MCIQRIANTIHAFPIHDTAVLEIRVVQSLEARFAAHKEFGDAAGPGDKHRCKHVVHKRVAGSFKVRNLNAWVQEKCAGKGCAGGLQGSGATLLASKSSITPLTCWNVAIASFLP